MDKTVKLYLRDPYTVSFQANALAADRRPDGRCHVILDQTFFYPESGGQLADRGTINGAAVMDVQEGDGETVVHEVAGDVTRGRIEGEVDWKRRFDHMQHHTGQHVLSRAFIEVGGLETISFHMGDDYCTIDVVGGELTEAVARKAEALANSVVWENREVRIKTLSTQQASEAGLRKSLPEGVEEVRLVEVDEFDVIGCCGTHVRRTGELGLIKVLKLEKAKAAHRVYFKVGRRALAELAEKHDIVKELANRFTTSVDALLEKTDKIEADGQRARKDVQRLSRRLAALEAQRLVADAKVHAERRYVADVFPGESEEYVKALAAELKKHPNTVGLVASDGGLVVCNASPDVSIDLAGAVVERAKALGGNGGGKGGFATVRLPASAPVTEFLDAVLKDIVED